MRSQTIVNRLVAYVLAVVLLPLNALTPVHATPNPTSTHVTPHSTSTLTEGLIAHYPFNGNANDMSGNGNHGVPHGGLQYTTGPRGSVASFDGVDDYIDVEPQSDMSTVGDFSLAVWTYVQGWKTNPRVWDELDSQYIIDAHSFSSTATSDFFRPGFAGLFHLHASGQEQIHNAILYDENNWREQNTAHIVKGVWRFMVFMRRGDQDYTYMDGQLIASTYVHTTDISAPLNMNHPWFIGTAGGNNPNYPNPGLPPGSFNYSFYGLMDDLRIYNRALSEGEILDLYHLPLLSTYILAFDGNPLSPWNLDAYTNATMQSITDATCGHPEKQAAVWLDRSGNNHDGLYHVIDCVVTEVSAQWPGMMMTELDSADGEKLGDFLQWARATYPADKNTVTVITHNMPVPMHADLREFLQQRPAYLTHFGPYAPFSDLFPLPTHIGGNPDLSDYTSERLLSTVALAQALEIGSDQGAAPFDVVNIASCFGATLESLYPLRHFAQTVVAGANYLNFSPDFAGAALTALNPADTAEDMAVAVVNAYRALVPPTRHPYLLGAFRTTPLDAVKEAWDSLSYYLLQGLNDPTHVVTYTTYLRASYLAVGKYDGTFCPPQDWECANPDPVVDAGQFTTDLRDRFGELSEVGIAASDALSALEQMVITRAVQNGTPWYAAPRTPNWNFDNRLGAGVYADLGGEPLPGGLTRLSPISAWYTSTVIPGRNERPYEFLTNTLYGVSWADVFYRYWALQNTTLTSTLCFPNFPPVLVEGGDVQALNYTFPLTGWVRVGATVEIAPTFRTLSATHNLWVDVAVQQAGAVVFSETVVVPYLPAGAHQIALTHQWVPTGIGPYSITTQFDANDAISETNEANNVAVLTGLVRQPAVLPALTAATVNGQQWFDTLTIPLSLTQVMTEPLPTGELINRLVIDIWGFAPDSDPNTQVSMYLGRRIIDPISLPQMNWELSLPANTPNGRVILHIWPRSPLGGLGYPAMVEFNVVQPNTALNANPEHFYTFNVPAGQQVALTCQTSSGSARLNVWAPHNPWTAQTMLCNGTMPIAPTVAGEYLVSVEGLANGTLYTLSGQQGSTPLRPLAPQAALVETVARPRPQFVAPIPVVPVEWVMYMPLVVR